MRPVIGRQPHRRHHPMDGPIQHRHHHRLTKMAERVLATKFTCLGGWFSFAALDRVEVFDSFFHQDTVRTKVG
jgi:hypothetical protein